MSFKSATFKCDRCPTEATTTVALSVPDGWLGLGGGGPGLMPQSIHLCPECFIAFETHMGPDFKLQRLSGT